MFLKVVFRIASLVVNNKKLVSLKKNMLEDDENISDDNLEIEKRYRRITRIVFVMIFVLYFSTVALFLISPLFFQHKFSMPAYVQLPGTK